MLKICTKTEHVSVIHELSLYSKAPYFSFNVVKVTADLMGCFQFFGNGRPVEHRSDYILDILLFRGHT